MVIGAGERQIRCQRHCVVRETMLTAGLLFINEHDNIMTMSLYCTSRGAGGGPPHQIAGTIGDDQTNNFIGKTVTLS